MPEQKLKIILVNYRYFVSSGPERYMFNLTEMLTRNGHTIVPFSIKSYYNDPSPYEDSFMDQIGDGKQIYFNEYNKKNVSTVVRSLSRMWYSFEAKRKLEALIEKEKPDLVYVLFYQNKISMSIFDAARKMKVPVIHRVSDFSLLCAGQLFYRYDKKEICEKCLHGSKLNAIVHKCVYDSYLYSSIKVISLKIHQFLNLNKKIDGFVIPSAFTLSKLKAAGFPENKLNHIPTFFNFNIVDKSLQITYEPFALYIGRIEEEKGLLTLIKAFENTPFKLKIIGFSQSGYDKSLMEYLKDKKHNIEFLGKKNFQEIQYYLSSCLFTVVPSEMYDNFPNTILESFAFKKCVLATKLPSMAGIVTDNETGLLYKFKDSADLSNRLKDLFWNPERCIELGNKAFQKLQDDFSEERHYKKLMKLFASTIFNYNRKAPVNQPAILRNLNSEGTYKEMGYR